MEKEKWNSICKIVAIVSVISSLLVALLPCFAFKEEVLTGLISDYARGDVSVNDLEGWEDNLLDLFADTATEGVINEMNGGLTGNMIRSAGVILSACAVYSYSNNKYLSLLYFVLLLAGVPILSLITAGFHIWGKSKNRNKLLTVFLGINVLLAISIFIVIPIFSAGIIQDLVSTTLGVDVGSILMASVRTLVFQLMLRCMSIGYWGFLVLQLVALVCTIVCLVNDTDETQVVKKVAKAAGKLMGITGAYAGAEVELGAGGIILGRDAGEAQLIIDSPKISRRHCQIIYDNAKNQYVVTDYSSNGTFVGSRRLTKGVAEILPSGTIINLGDSKTSFRLQ